MSIFLVSLASLATIYHHQEKIVSKAPGTVRTECNGKPEKRQLKLK